MNPEPPPPPSRTRASQKQSWTRLTGARVAAPPSDEAAPEERAWDPFDPAGEPADTEQHPEPEAARQVDRRALQAALDAVHAGAQEWLLEQEFPDANAFALAMKTLARDRPDLKEPADLLALQMIADEAPVTASMLRVAGADLRAWLALVLRPHGTPRLGGHIRRFVRRRLSRALKRCDLHESCQVVEIPSARFHTRLGPPCRTRR